MNYSTPIIDDYNEIVGPTNNLPLDDIQAHPEEYLNYEYTENKTDGTVKKCVQDTNFSPDEYAQAWEDA